MNSREHDLPIIYLWLRSKLTDPEAKIYRLLLVDMASQGDAYGLDAALQETAQRLVDREGE